MLSLFCQFSLTPLHLACWYGQESVVRLLLEHGANVNALDRVSKSIKSKAPVSQHVNAVLTSNYTLTKDSWTPCGNKMLPERYKIVCK